MDGLDRPVFPLWEAAGKPKLGEDESWWLRASRASTISSSTKPLDAILRHPDALVLATLLADTARNVCSGGPMREVVPAGSRQGGL